MTRLEAIIYAIGELDGMPRSGVTSRVDLNKCNQCFEEDYQICRINVLGSNTLYLAKAMPTDNIGNILLQIDRDDFDVHEAAVLIDTAYGMYSKRHKNE